MDGRDFAPPPRLLAERGGLGHRHGTGRVSGSAHSTVQPPGHFQPAKFFPAPISMATHSGQRHRALGGAVGEGRGVASCMRGSGWRHGGRWHGGVSWGPPLQCQRCSPPGRGGALGANNGAVMRSKKNKNQKNPRPAPTSPGGDGFAAPTFPLPAAAGARYRSRARCILGAAPPAAAALCAVRSAQPRPCGAAGGAAKQGGGPSGVRGAGPGSGSTEPGLDPLLSRCRPGPPAPRRRFSLRRTAAAP